MGWVALRLGGGMGSRIREDNGWGRGRKDGGLGGVAGGGWDGFPHPSSWGQVLRGGTGMGPRIREDNGVGEGGRMMGGWRCGVGGGMGPRIREDNGVGEMEEGWWAGGVAGGTAFEYNGLKYPQIPVV